MLLQIAAKAADAISAGDVVNRKVLYLFELHDLSCSPTYLRACGGML